MFEEFTEYLAYIDAEKGVEPSTIQNRERNLREFHDWVTTLDDDHKLEPAKDISDINRRHVSHYIDHLVDERYAVNTIMRSKYSSISAALTYLYNERFIETNPMDRIKRDAMKKKARDVMSDDEKKAELGAKDHLKKEEVYELAESAPEPTDRNELLIKLLFWTGCRVSEIVGISLTDDGRIEGEGSDIEPNTPQIVVYAPKNDEPRVVSYPRPEINPLLRDWVSHGRLRYKCADSTDRLFIGRKGPLTKSGINQLIDKAAENAGMQEKKREARDGRTYKRVTPHLLRHSHAMHYHNEEDVPLDDLKSHLGHSSIDTTQNFYAEKTNEKMVETFGE